MVFGYKEKRPNEERKALTKTPREISKEITDGKIKPQHIGPRSIEVVTQELISHIQNYQETFNSAELNMWENRLNTLTHELQKFRK